jgi:hypothetical protein
MAEYLQKLSAYIHGVPTDRYGDGRIQCNLGARSREITRASAAVSPVFPAQAPATHIQLREYLSIPIVREPPVAHANAKEEEKIK